MAQNTHAKTTNTRGFVGSVMSELTIDDPEYVATKRVDNQGRLYVGQEYTGERVRVVIERAEPEDENNERTE